MFGSYPCVYARDGVFVLAACLYAAVWSRVFFSSDFGPLFAAFIAAPLDPPLAFAVWGVVFASGVILLVAGVRENLQDGHGAPVFLSLAVIFACTVSMHHGWYLPWRGVVGLHISRGIYVAVIAACCANLCMALVASSRKMQSSPTAALRRERRADNAALAKYRQTLAAYVERDEKQRRMLVAAVAENDEMKAVLAFPGMRAALLHALHSDHHAGASEGERRIRDDTFIKLTAIYQRIERSP